MTKNEQLLALGDPQILTNAQVADALDISLGNARIIRHRAIKSLGLAAPGKAPAAEPAEPTEAVELPPQGLQASRKGKKWLITSACRGALPHFDFLRNLETYAKTIGAKILIVEVGSHNKALREWDEGPLHPAFEAYEILHLGEELVVNDNVRISALNIKPQQVDPTSGLHQIIKNGSYIVGSPKLRYKLFATSASKLPKVAAATGCATLPTYLPNRIGQLAHAAHKFGAIYLEPRKRNHFELRQIEADDDGMFYDLCRTPDGHLVRPEAISLGDWHTAYIHPDIRKLTHKMLREWEPKRVFIHDIFDGRSINHHEVHNLVGRYKSHQAGVLCLQHELDAVGRELMAMHHACKSAELVVVKSNHDEFLSRLLDSGNLRDHFYNLGTLYKLGAAMCEGYDPLEAGVSLPPHVSAQVRWLQRDEDYTVCGTQMADHGDKGANGSRGTPKQTKAVIGSAVQGHTHTADRDGDTITNGTSTLLDMGYNKGPGSWVHAHTVVYPNGTKQLFTIIDPKRFKV